MQLPEDARRDIDPRTDLLREDVRKVHRRMADLSSDGMKGEHMYDIARVALHDEIGDVIGSMEQRIVDQLVCIIADEYLIETDPPVPSIG